DRHFPLDRYHEVQYATQAFAFRPPRSLRVLQQIPPRRPAGRRQSPPLPPRPSDPRHASRASVEISYRSLARAGVDPIEIVAAFGKRLFGIHLRDHDVKANKPATLGKGSLLLLPLLRALRENKFLGFFSIEEEGDDPVPGIRAALELLRMAA
ncbi:MAG: hypothetical protein JXP34_18210, partial [Planctomycetes bacterium]|nr:hypothetical protein [Planctomycetota bacterium]